MTISTRSIRNDYDNSSGGTTFPYTFKIFDENDIQVTTITGTVETVKTLTTHYSVTGVDDEAGGTVVFTSAVAAGTTVHIVAKLDRGSGVGLALTQTTDLVNETGFYQDRIEDRFDILCRQVQIVADESARSLKISDTADPDDYDLELPAPEAGSVIGSLDGVSFTNIATIDLDSAISGSWIVETFDAGSDFTAGSTTALTMVETPPSVESILASFDGIVQNVNTMTLVGSTITFDAAIPLGTTTVELRIPKTAAVLTPAADSVNTAAIQNLAVTTAKINDLAVTTGKLADLAVTTGKINDLAVTTAKINDLAVTSGKIASGAVTNSKITPTAGLLPFWARLANATPVSISGTGTYLASDDRLHMIDPGGDKTFSLNSAVGREGTVVGFILKNTSTPSAYTTRIVPFGSQKIDGGNSDLYIQPEGGSVLLYSDGTGWRTLANTTPVVTKWVNAGTTTIDAVTSAPTKGTIVYDRCWWRRVGDSLEVRVEFSASTLGGSGSGDYLFALPDVGYGFTSLIDTGLVMLDSAAIPTSHAYGVGHGTVCDGTPSSVRVHVVPYTASSVRLVYYNSAGTTATAVGSSNFDLGATVQYHFTYTVPIVMWRMQ